MALGDAGDNGCLRKRGVRAETFDMAAIWYWVFRNPFALAAAAFVAMGAVDVIGWPLALSGAAFTAVVADLGWRMGRRAKARARRAKQASSVPSVLEDARAPERRAA